MKNETFCGFPVIYSDNLENPHKEFYKDVTLYDPFEYGIDLKDLIWLQEANENDKF